MTLTSLSFFAFLVCALVAFYIAKPLQKYILLIASLYFYIAISPVSTLKLLMIVIYIPTVTYIGAIIIERTDGIMRSAVLAISVLGLVAPLVVFKYAFNLLTAISEILNVSPDISWLRFASIIGISYYALSAIGYVVDVYWKAYKAEKNPANVALFIFYFPQLISGPITRYDCMREQIDRRTSLDYENITNGMRRMAWGYFKKLVISERFGIVVAAVYGDYESYGAFGIVGATLCYAVQLYTDFSGCMDIIMGASKLFGITLPENFKAPFFSETIQEFWQRWHITLGTWFKDYLMFPLQKSSLLQKAGKAGKRRFGKKAGRKVPFYLSMLVLWVLIGIWHGGTGYYFIASAGIPCVLLMLSDFSQPLFDWLVKSLKINTTCESWHWFRSARTLLLICICWVFACSNSTATAINIIEHMFSDLCYYTPLVDVIRNVGLSSVDILLMVVGLVILFVADRCVYRGTTIFEVMDRQNLGIRILLIYAEVFSVLLYGMVGTSSFIYFQF